MTYLYLSYNFLKSKAARPLLRIISTSTTEKYEEIMADALSVRGFENYECNHYHLGK